MNQQTLQAVALSQVKGLGLHTLRSLLAHYGSPSAIFEASQEGFVDLPKLRSEAAKQIKEKATFSEAEAILAYCEKQRISVLFYQDEDYPALLRQIYSPPMLLYVKGQLDVLRRHPSVAFIGTRSMTSYGRKQLGLLCEALVPHRPLLIGGFGEGVERALTKEALRLKLPLAVVYPAGLNHPYPLSTPMELIAAACKHGCLVSEHAPDTPLLRHGFLARNRLIVGLSEQLVLIESKRKGGAMATASLAQGENRELHALPGDWGRATSEGPHQLVRQHMAHLLSCPDDLLRALKLTTATAHETAQPPSSTQLELQEEQQKIINQFGTSSETYSIDALSDALAIPTDKLNVLLFELECLGLVEQLPGNNYRLRLS